MLNLLEEFLPLVSKPGRYVGGELHSIRKEWNACDVHVALAFPDIYEIGMSHLGLKILYHIINSNPRWLAERAFCPWMDMEKHMRRRNVPLYALESFRPLREFDVVGFSLQYEMTFTNVLSMLDLARIPLLSADRTTEDPLIIAGGPCALNPEPMADFIDAFVIGEAEEVIVKLLGNFEEAKRNLADRREILTHWSGIDGVYIPSLYDVTYSGGKFSRIVPKEGAPESVNRLWIENLDAAPFPTAPPVPLIEAIHDRFVVEIMRGCSRGCRFCHAGMTYRPVRERNVDTICRLVEEGIAETGYDAVTLASLSSTDYSRIEELVNRLTRRFSDRKVSISLPSLRLDTFSIEIAEKIQEVRKSGFTFAPEAATDRLRKVINKNYTEDEMFHSLESALMAGWDIFKLYFMLGLPTETDKDLEAIASLVSGIRALGRKISGKRFRTNVSLSAFVSKPHTPFQWENMVSEEDLQRKYKYITSRIPPRDVKVNWRETSLCLLEALLARGDRRIGKIILSAWKAGAKFDAWSSELKFDAWKQAMSEHNINFETVTAFPYAPEDTLPWDHIQTGVTKKYLLKERERSRTAEFTSDCREKCLGCGVCGHVDLSY
jgi:radical SAM family uncharacterized protein